VLQGGKKGKVSFPLWLNKCQELCPTSESSWPNYLYVKRVVSPSRGKSAKAKATRKTVHNKKGKSISAFEIIPKPYKSGLYGLGIQSRG